jgi:hypothetical protein
VRHKETMGLVELGKMNGENRASLEHRRIETEVERSSELLVDRALDLEVIPGQRMFVWKIACGRAMGFLKSLGLTDCDAYLLHHCSAQ